jgi:uncharacterized membrane protein YhaH (DUF805 family)
MDHLPVFHFILLLLVFIGFLILYFVPIVKILQKAGYSGWWSLIILVPVVNIIMFYVFAFSTWPVLRGRTQHRTS